MSRMAMIAMVIAAVALALISIGCGDKATTTQQTETNSAGKVTGYTECKLGANAASRGDVSGVDDCIEYTYDGNSVLTMKHVNAGFNCCPDSLLAAFHLSVGEIIIDESEDLTTGGCHCLCLYDLNYQITGLAPGHYNIRVNQPYLKSGADVVDFSMDLTSVTSGSFCVTRNFYPWITE